MFFNRFLIPGNKKARTTMRALTQLSYKTKPYLTCQNRQSPYCRGRHCRGHDDRDGAQIH